MHARDRAKKSGIPFTITMDDLYCPPACPVLYRPWGRGDARPSLDRLVPRLGYVPGNVRVISLRANVLKSDGTWLEHAMVSEWLKAQLYPWEVLRGS